MKTFNSTIYGLIKEPESFEEIISAVTGRKETNHFFARFWRGQGNVEWPIEPTTMRRVQNSAETHPIQSTFERAITTDRWMIERAKHAGFHLSKGRSLDDWELIVLLRHFGASTLLLDVSKNPLVALWFYCSSEPSEFGLVHGTDCNQVGGSEGAVFKSEYFEDIKTAHEYEHPILFDPMQVSPRVAAQSSCFLYGCGGKSSKGSMFYEGLSDSYELLAISPEMKLKCLEILDQSFCINRLTLFPDIEGFSQSNSPDFSPSSNHRW